MHLDVELCFRWLSVGTFPWDWCEAFINGEEIFVAHQSSEETCWDRSQTLSPEVALSIYVFGIKNLNPKLSFYSVRRICCINMQSEFKWALNY